MTNSGCNICKNIFELFYLKYQLHFLLNYKNGSYPNRSSPVLKKYYVRGVVWKVELQIFEVWGCMKLTLTYLWIKIAMNISSCTIGLISENCRNIIIACSILYNPVENGNNLIYEIFQQSSSNLCTIQSIGYQYPGAIYQEVVFCWAWPSDFLAIYPLHVLSLFKSSHLFSVTFLSNINFKKFVSLWLHESVCI
jgi:hypothetical protein